MNVVVRNGKDSWALRIGPQDIIIAFVGIESFFFQNFLCGEVVAGIQDYLQPFNNILVLFARLMVVKGCDEMQRIVLEFIEIPDVEWFFRFGESVGQSAFSGPFGKGCPLSFLSAHIPFLHERRKFLRSGFGFFIIEPLLRVSEKIKIVKGFEYGYFFRIGNRRRNVLYDFLIFSGSDEQYALPVLRNPVIRS